MPARAASVGLASLLCLAGCANLWGFTDFTLGDAGDGGDGTVLNGATDASSDAPLDTTTGNDSTLMPDHGGDAGLEGGVDALVDSGPGSDADGGPYPEAGADADGGCGPTTTVMNCGACGNTCNSANAYLAECDAGTCTYVCDSNHADCDAAPPNTHGCDTPITTVLNCGGCGQACDTKHSNNASCIGGTCIYQSCAAGWADCDPQAPDLNGCETLVSGAAGCGGCSQACDTDSGHSLNAVCEAGTCTYSGCAPGWADCNTTPPDTHGCNTSLSTPSDCGMCGRACNKTTGTPSCDGTTCSYLCNSGRANCNTTAPNTAGCECTTPGCCGSTCQFTHSTGISGGVAQTYYDCVALGTYDQVQAGKACAAFTGSSTECTVSTASLCLGGLLGGQGVSASSVCSSGAASCYCWQYSGPNQGKVQTVTGACTASCGGGNDPGWN